MPGTTQGWYNRHYLIFWNAVPFKTAFPLIRCRFLLAEKGQEFVNRIQLQVPRQNKAVSIVLLWIGLE